MLNVALLSGIMLSVAKLYVVMIFVTMLNVLAALAGLQD